MVVFLVFLWGTENCDANESECNEKKNRKDRLEIIDNVVIPMN
jgi:hypothetical protein